MSFSRCYNKDGNISFLRNPDNRGAMAVKQWVDNILCSSAVGHVIAMVTGGVVPIYGLRIDTRSSVVSPQVPAQLLWRIYESAELRLLDRYLCITECIVELGTSLGVVASAAARRLPAGGRFIGVEANPELIEIAYCNITRNAPAIDTEVIHGAIDYSSPRGSSVMFSSNSSHTASKLMQATADGEFSAPVIRLGNLLRERGITDYVLIMDIEGAEAGLLLRDPQSLTLCRQILVELHNTEYDSQPYTCTELRSRIEELGFRVKAQYGNVMVFNR